jgi:hypothetical protein
MQSSTNLVSMRIESFGQRKSIARYYDIGTGIILTRCVERFDVVPRD